MLTILDFFLTFLHSAIVLFILFGWVSQKTRKAHFALLTLTILSWIILGGIIGTFGYCPITDWQWDIKRDLGEKNLPGSFIQYAVDKTFSINSNKQLVDLFTILGLVFGVTMAAVKKWGHLLRRNAE